LFAAITLDDWFSREEQKRGRIYLAFAVFEWAKKKKEKEIEEPTDGHALFVVTHRE